MIDAFFLPFKSQQIKAIPLGESAQSDFLYWSLEKKNVVYLVKSSYKCICEDSMSEEASGSTRSAASGLWFGIWKLKMPRKIKHFLWKACAKILPTKVNLMKRKILSSPLYHLCGRCPEDTKRALWDCEVVKSV